MTRRVTRRTFLASGSMASAGALLAPRQPSPRVHDVVVLGAGMAGLTAARRLAKAGLDVVVLEARDRVGGRMHTLTDPTPHGIEVGAQVVHGSRADTWELLRELGTETRPIGGARRSMSWSKDRGFYKRDYKHYGQVVERIAAEFSEYRGGDMSYEAFLEKIGLTTEERELVADEALGWASEPDEISLRSVMEDNPTWEAYLDVNYQVVGGYSGVAAKMAEELDGKIYLSSVIDSIEWKRGNVRINVTREGRSETVHAERAVVTLPIGVLQTGKPSFSPALPEWKRKSIDALRMGRVVVAHFLFDRYFWREQEIRGFMARAGRISIYDPHPDESGMPVLMGWIDGTAAQELSNLGIEDGKARVLEWIDTAFADVDVKKHLKWSNLRDWIADPYSLGCYSFTRPGGKGQRAVLATPIEESLYFAGEATVEPPHYQTVHGAYRSGKRAAREILAGLGMAAD